MAGAEAPTDEWRGALGRFEALAALSAEERARELQRIEASDPALHERLKSLLDADRDAGEADFLSATGGASVLARRALAATQDDAVDLAGRMLGPYTLERELGVGGMGRVWLARRSDGLYEGQVAIKLLKASLAERGARERFAREGRILGKLAHPHIARLLDAGTLEDGQLYLVLEHVEGERIDRYCESQGLDARARARLFNSVCEAVAYAHANLVVHRDLKPSNILVTPLGEVKLLDFGIAKLIADEDSTGEETELTQLAGRALTPEYAAPEQVSGAPITTATDVYSLGVVLYHLVSGRSPYQHDDGSRPSAFDLQRAVLEQEPRRLGAKLAGDLDNIVGKALKKRPAERYASAQAMRDDLSRYLEHRPVEARPDSAGYLLGRFVRRHRVAVGAAAAVLVAIGIGFAGIAYQARIAKQEGVRAQAQADKAKAVSDFMAGIFDANSTAHTDPAKARSTTARELLDIGRDRAAKDLANNPEALQEVLLLIGRNYYQLGLTAESLKLDSARVELLRKLDGSGLRLAEALANLAGTTVSGGDAVGGEKAAQESIALYEAANGLGELKYAIALSSLANAQRYRDTELSLATMRKASAVFEAHHPMDRHNAFHQRAMAIALNELGRPQEGAVAIARGIEVGKAALGPGHRDMAFLYQVAGVMQTALMHHARAQDEFLRGIEIDERAMGLASTFRPYLEIGLARATQAGDGWQAGRDRLAAHAATLDPANASMKRPIYFVQVQLAQVHLREGHLAQARALFAKVMPDARKQMSKQILASLLGNVAELEILSGNEPAATALLAELRQVIAGPMEANKTIAARAAELDAMASLLRGDAAGARTMTQERLAALARDGPGLHPLAYAPLQLVHAQALERSGAAEEAQARAREVLASVESHPDRAWFGDIEATAALRVGTALVALGRRAEAKPFLQRALTLRTARQHPASPLLAEARRFL